MGVPGNCWGQSTNWTSNLRNSGQSGKEIVRCCPFFDTLEGVVHNMAIALLHDLLFRDSYGDRAGNGSGF
jgi:hypothetical protein